MGRLRRAVKRGRLGLVTIAVAAAALPAAAPVAGATGCPCSLFAASLPADVAPGSFELGVRIEATAPARVTALRFWKDVREAGSHVGRVWADDGTELAHVAFANETPSGWQEQALATPLTLVPGSVYVISVGVNTHYVATIDGLNGQVTAGPLQTAAGPNGVYAANGDFPTSTWLAQNYFVDVVAEPVPAPNPVPTPADSSTELPSAPAQLAGDGAQPTQGDSEPQVVPFPLDELSVVIVKTPSWRTVATSSRRTWVAVAASGARPARMQLATKLARPWAWRSYLSAFSFRTRQPAIWARFALADDTVTSWHRISLAPKRR